MLSSDYFLALNLSQKSLDEMAEVKKVARSISWTVWNMFLKWFLCELSCFGILVLADLVLECVKLKPLFNSKKCRKCTWCNVWGWKQNHSRTCRDLIKYIGFPWCWFFMYLATISHNQFVFTQRLHLMAPITEVLLLLPPPPPPTTTTPPPPSSSSSSPLLLIHQPRQSSSSYRRVQHH